MPSAVASASEEKAVLDIRDEVEITSPQTVHSEELVVRVACYKRVKKAVLLSTTNVFVLNGHRHIV